MKIQINNDFQLALSVLANGTAEPLTYATDIEVAVQNLDAPRVRCTLAPVVVNGNVVTVAVDSTVLNTTGRYLAAITYVINGARRYAENGDAFTLVRSAAEADIEGESAAADLHVKFEASGKDGLSAYELAKQAGYAGTFEEWLAAGENANNAALLAKEGAALAATATKAATDAAQKAVEATSVANTAANKANAAADGVTGEITRIDAAAVGSLQVDADADKVAVKGTSLSGKEVATVGIPAATTERAGVMSAEDKTLIVNNLGVDGNLSDIAKRVDNVEELISKPITPNDTTFFKPSVNVVNWFEIDIRGWSLSSAETSTTYVSTDFIRLKPNTKYTINQRCRKVYTFRNSGEFEDSVILGANPRVQEIDKVYTFTTGEYDFYVRLMVANGEYNINTIMLVEGDSLPEEYVSPAPKIYPEYIPPVKEKKRITAIGSSGLALLSGGQWALSDEQKQNYNVTDDLTMARVLQVLLGYDETNIIAIGGNTASNTMFLCGLSAYRLKNSFTLYADASDTYYEWTTSTIEAQMTENLNTVGNIKSNGSFTGVVNGVEVYVYPNGSIIRPTTAIESDVVIPEGSMLYRKPSILRDDKNGTKRDIIQESYGLLLQIGANDEGNTPEELLNYFDLAIKASGCKWFICLPKNGNGIHSTSELNNAIPLLKKKYGSRFIDHRPYMCSLQALIDQGITPTTSDTYPDKNGTNSNPLNETQIANGVPCDMQCISQGRYPSSFWHSAYRANEPNNQTINNTHFNAQGLEAWGKFLYKMVKTIYIE